jgi:hypothetical protein
MRDIGPKWMRLARQSAKPAAYPPSPIAADDPGADMLLHRARVHGAVARQKCEVMQGNLHRREELVQRRADGSAFGLEKEIFAYDELISSQIADIDWHLDEARRLRSQVAWRSRARSAHHARLEP